MDYYKFKEKPFSLTADPDFFFCSQRHTDAFANLKYGVDERKGILVLTGEIGTGKTTLCQTLISSLDKKTNFAYIFNPKFSHLQLLQVINKELGISATENTKFELVDALNSFLIRETSQGHNTVIILDESQNLTIKQLEAIRLLSNLETRKEKLVQIVLVGQPELNKVLKSPDIRQLNQRIAVRFHLEPLNEKEIADYIQHRLKVANKRKFKPPRVSFSNDAIHTIYSITKGSPREINLLCDRALLAGFASELRRIDHSIIETCAKEVFSV